MSTERKKLIWIAVSACAFILVLAATGFFLFAPRKTGGGLAAPASMGNTAVPKATDPQDFLMTPPPPPPSDQSRSGDVIVVYGDKPQGVGAAGQAPAAGGTQTNPAAGATALPTGTGAGPGGAPVAAAASTAKPRTPVSTAALTTKSPPPVKKTKAEQYWIQAGSFTSRSRADDLKTALAAKGIASLITVKDIAGTSWYRVRVGPYGIKAQAQDWLTKVKTIPDCGTASLWSEVVLR